LLVFTFFFYGCKTAENYDNDAKKIAVAKRCIDPIKIDGQLIEKSWKQASWVGHDHILLKKNTPVERSYISFLWDDVYLYFAAKIIDREIAQKFKGKDQPVWREDCIEYFIDPLRTGNYYYEMNFGASGAHWDSIAYRIESRPMPSVVEKGWNPESLTFKTLKTGDGWQLEGKIRFDDLKAADTIPPHHGDQWYFNTYRVNQPKKGKSTLTSWNPTDAFHNTANFGVLKFSFPERARMIAKREISAENFLNKTDRIDLLKDSMPIKSIIPSGPKNDKYVFDSEKDIWRAPEGKNYVAFADEVDIPGIFEIKSYDGPVNLSIKAEKNISLKLLIRNSDKSADFIKRGIADGTVTTLKTDDLHSEVYSYRAKWQLITLQLHQGRKLVINIDPGPAKNKSLDRTLIGIYVSRY